MTLTLEQCRWLKEKGFPQALECGGGVVYDVVDHTNGWGPLPEHPKDEDFELCKVWNGLVCNAGLHNWDSDWCPPSKHAIRRPDLEALLEWAREKIGHTLHLLPQLPSLSNGDCWVATDSSTAQSGHDSDPKQAVYKLLEEVRSDG